MSATPGPRNWTRVALVLSLALNLAVAGIVAGAVLRGHRDGPPRGFDLAVGPVARALSEVDRRAVMRDLMDRRDLRDDRRDDSAAAAPVLAAVRADPFDPAALSAALDGMRGRARDLEAAAEAALVARVAAMTPAERAAFADRLAQELERRR